MICGKDLIIKYLDETNKAKESITITTTEPNASPFDRDKQVGRDSIDLRIASTGYKIMCNYDFINTLDLEVDKYFYDITLENDGYIIQPGETIIVNTVEKITLTGNIIGELTGRTRFARMGLSICSATKFQSYSDAIIVLQICNNNKVPLKIFPYQKLAQMVIHQVDGIPNEIRGKYHNEITLKKPIIDKEELAGLSAESKKTISRQTPQKLSFVTIDGDTDVKKRLTQNNKIMNVCSKISSSLSVILGVIIGIICSLPTINATAIMIMSISSVLLTIMSVILEFIKDNNTID